MCGWVSISVLILIWRKCWVKGVYSFGAALRCYVMTDRDRDVVAVRVTLDVVVDRDRWLLQTSVFSPVPPPGWPVGREWPLPEMVEEARVEIESLDVHEDVVAYAAAQLSLADHLDEAGASVHLVGFERLAAADL